MILWINKEESCWFEKYRGSGKEELLAWGNTIERDDLSAGDEIVFERVESGDNIRYFITIQKYDESFSCTKVKVWV